MASGNVKHRALAAMLLALGFAPADDAVPGLLMRRAIPLPVRPPTSAGAWGLDAAALLIGFPLLTLAVGAGQRVMGQLPPRGNGHLLLLPH